MTSYSMLKKRNGRTTKRPKCHIFIYVNVMYVFHGITKVICNFVYKLWITTKNVSIKMLEMVSTREKKTLWKKCVKLDSMHVEILKMCSTTITMAKNTMNQNEFIKRLAVENVSSFEQKKKCNFKMRNFWIAWRNVFRLLQSGAFHSSVPISNWIVLYCALYEDIDSQAHRERVQELLQYEPKHHY